MPKPLAVLWLAALPFVSFYLADCGGDPAISVPIALPTEITRVSVDSAGGEALAASSVARLSANGRFVVFESTAANLVPGDINAVADVFLHDVSGGATSRVSLGAGGLELDALSSVADISADGLTVSFLTTASNVGFGANPAIVNMYLRHRVTGVINWASAAPGGTDPDTSLFVDGTLGANGQLAGFTTQAGNLVPGDTNIATDVFVYDQSAGTTTRVSVPLGGGEADDNSIEARISPDGRYVAFRNQATNLVAPFTGGNRNIVMVDRVTGVVTPVSVTPGGGQPNGDSAVPAISANGAFIAFESAATDLGTVDTNSSIDIYLRDLVGGAIVRVSEASDGTQAQVGGDSGRPSISADGRYVAFQSDSTTFGACDGPSVTDVFVHDRLTLATACVSVDAAGVQGDGHSTLPRISADGRFVVFQSVATNLVPEDTGPTSDIFIAPNPLY